MNLENRLSKAGGINILGAAVGGAFGSYFGLLSAAVFAGIGAKAPDLLGSGDSGGHHYMLKNRYYK